MADVAGLSTASLTIGQTVFTYSYFMPPLREVRKANPDDPDMRGDVLMGQLAAGSVSMSVGMMLTWMTGSKAPVMTTLFIAVVIAVLYQYALNGGRMVERA
jgi:hypothetical protein